MHEAMVDTECSKCVAWYWSMIPGQWCLFFGDNVFGFWWREGQAPFIDSKHGNIELKKMKIKYLVSLISVLNKCNNVVIKRVEINGIGQTME